MRKLELILSGPRAADAIPRLEAALGGATLPAARPMDDAADAGRRSLDPAAVAALLVSIPSAALAVVELTDRLTKRRRAKALIETAVRIRGEQRVEVMVVTPKGPLALTDLDPDALLALVEPADRAEPQKGGG